MEKGEPKKATESNGSDEESDKRRMGAGYQGAVEAALAIPIGSGLGHLADQQWGTEPVGLYIGLVVGFGAFVLRLFRMRPE
ncbi:MAG: AtpZ/AtpI family protein [Myxococcota bacterium]|jgi:F0F1-type ATP synthase assembly protein I|nr:AtpZ/AtpI family protein [Myxococcota bacterium]